MDIRWRIKRWFWGSGKTVGYVFIHPTCASDDVEAGYLPEWGHPKFLCRRCGVAFDEAKVRLRWAEPSGCARMDPGKVR